MRYLTSSGHVPVFWTREQRGEEASVRLFCRHEYEYLRRIREHYDCSPLGRAFCVPADPAERVILLAEYLELDIDWLARRCRSLARVGWDRLAAPRSRLLSLEGLEGPEAAGRLPVRSREAGWA